MTGPADPPEGDLDRLLRECVEAAGRALAASGGFWPFAVALTRDGGLVSPDVDPGEPRPDPLRVVRLLRTALRADADGLRATAVCTDARVTVGGATSAALRVELEPRDDAPLTLVVPYERGPDGRPVFGAPEGQRDEPRVFA